MYHQPERLGEKKNWEMEENESEVPQMSYLSNAGAPLHHERERG
jgi:hypothetical protein